MSLKMNKILRLLFLGGACLVWAALSFAANVNTRALTGKSKSQKVSESQRARRRMNHLARSRSVTTAGRRTTVHRRHRYYERFYTSSYAEDITEGDTVAGEDPVVRQAAIDALGNMNGTVVAIEPTLSSMSTVACCCTSSWNAASVALSKPAACTVNAYLAAGRVGNM